MVKEDYRVDASLSVIFDLFSVDMEKGMSLLLRILGLLLKRIEGDVLCWDDSITMILKRIDKNIFICTELKNYYFKIDFYDLIMNLERDYNVSILSKENTLELKNVLKVQKIKRKIEGDLEYRIRRKYKVFIKEKVLPLPTESYLGFTEQYWRLRLPEKYRNFILNYNGGEPKYPYFLVNNQEYVVDRFLSVLEDFNCNAQGYYDIDVVLSKIEDRLSSNEELVGANRLPIAYLLGEDYVCLDFEEKIDSPSVCIWYNCESELYKPCTKKIADSFEEFINMLYAKEGQEIDTESEDEFNKVMLLGDEASEHYDKKEFEYSIEKFKYALELVPNPKEKWRVSTPIYTMIGLGYYNLDKYELALEYLLKSLDCPEGTGKSDVMFKIGECFYKLENFDKAKGFFYQAYMISGDEQFRNEDPKYFDIIKDTI